jgi:hypothetical protein
MMPPVSFPLKGGALQAEPDSALPAMTVSASRLDRISQISLDQASARP